METTQPQKKGFLSSLVGDIGVNTEVGFSQSAIFQTAAALFVLACLVILAYFTFNKLFK